MLLDSYFESPNRKQSLWNPQDYCEFFGGQIVPDVNWQEALYNCLLYSKPIAFFFVEILVCLILAAHDLPENITLYIWAILYS